MTADLPGIRLYLPNAAAELINGTKDANGSRRIVSARWLAEQAGKGTIPHTVMCGKRCWTLEQLREVVATFERPIAARTDDAPAPAAIASLTPRSRAALARRTSK